MGIKGENSIREHLIPCSNVTKSGIIVKYTVERLIACKEKENSIKGPAAFDPKDFLLSTPELDSYFHEVLMEIFEQESSLFPP